MSHFIGVGKLVGIELPCLITRRVIACLTTSHFMLLVMVLTAVFHRAGFAALPDDELRSLLERSLAAQQVMDHASWRVKTEITSVLPDRALEHHAEAWIRRDGDRVDSQGQYLYVDSLQERSYRFRSIIDGEQFIQYTRKLKETEPSKPARTAGAISKRKEEYLYRTIGVTHFGGALDGYLGALGHARLTALILKSNSFRHMGQQEIGSERCEIVEGDTEYGTVQLWVAPALGHSILQLHFDAKSKGSEGSADQGQSQKASSVRVVSTTILKDVEVEKIGDVFLPVAGKLSVYEKYADGHELTTVYASRREDIDLKPDWTDSDAFRSDMVDGTPVFDWDHKGNGVRYEWKDGRVVPAHANFQVSPEGGFGGSPGTVYVILFNGILLLVLGAFLLMKRVKS